MELSEYYNDLDGVDTVAYHICGDVDVNQDGITGDSSTILYSLTITNIDILITTTSNTATIKSLMYKFISKFKLLSLITIL